MEAFLATFKRNGSSKTFNQCAHSFSISFPIRLAYFIHISHLLETKRFGVNNSFRDYYQKLTLAFSRSEVN